MLPLTIVAQQMYTQTQSFPMLALPFFVLDGSLMMSGKLGQNLIDFVTSLVQRFAAGWRRSRSWLDGVGGVSGSAVSDATALGSMLITWHKREGYPASFVAANNSAAATIAILIPPSIPLHRRRPAGRGPDGRIRHGAQPVRPLPELHARSPTVRLAALHPAASPGARVIAMPVLMLVLLRFGIATPTEVSVLAVFYSLLAGILFYRDMTWRRFAHAVIAAGVSTGIVMLVIMASAVVGWIMTFVQAPQLFATWAIQTLQAPWLIIMAMIGIMLVAGMFIDLPAAILLADLRAAGRRRSAWTCCSSAS
jgi:TRAP-type C4-dicarboxylate transport system permease large subunit